MIFGAGIVDNHKHRTAEVRGRWNTTTVRVLTERLVMSTEVAIVS